MVSRALGVDDEREHGALPGPGFRRSFADANGHAAPTTAGLAAGLAAPMISGRHEDAADRLADRIADGVASERLEESAARAETSRAGTADGRLAESVRRPMERAFGFDFGTVRIHTDAEADRMGRNVQAHAITYGDDIFFRRGCYRPDEAPGRWLLAHELAHVVQQQTGSVAAPCIQPAKPKDKKKQTATKQTLKKQPAKKQTSAKPTKEEQDIAFLRKSAKNMSDDELRQALAFDDRRTFTSAELAAIDGDPRFFDRSGKVAKLSFEEILKARFDYGFTLDQIATLDDLADGELIANVIGRFEQAIGKKVLTSGLIEKREYIENLTTAVDELGSVEWAEVSGSFNNGGELEGEVVNLDSAYLPVAINNYKLTRHAIAHLFNPRNEAHRVTVSEIDYLTKEVDKQIAATGRADDERARYSSRLIKMRIIVNERTKTVITVYSPD